MELTTLTNIINNITIRINKPFEEQIQPKIKDSPRCKALRSQFWI